jgi:endo-1,4-beta-xylanase
MEFYIIENWSTYTPPVMPLTSRGTLTSDGGTYEVYIGNRVSAPSPWGLRDFPVIISFRTARRTSGTLSV